MSTLQIASTSILPAAIRYQTEVASSIHAAREALSSLDLSTQEGLLSEPSTKISRLRAGLESLETTHQRSEQQGDDPVAAAKFAREELIPAMDEVRRFADALEGLVDDALWPLPKYHELLFVH